MPPQMLLFLLLLLLAFKAFCEPIPLQRPLQSLILICDLDHSILSYDSIDDHHRNEKESNGGPWNRFKKLVSPLVIGTHKAPKNVPYMIELLNFLIEQGASLQVVSARNAANREHVQRLLSRLGLKKWTLWLNSNTYYGSSEYKRTTIESLFSLRPGNHFLLIGDNVDKDPQVYGQLIQSNAEKNQNQRAKILASFIRQVGPGNIDPKLHFVFQNGLDISEVLIDSGLIEASSLPSALRSGLSGAEGVSERASESSRQIRCNKLAGQ